MHRRSGGGRGELERAVRRMSRRLRANSAERGPDAAAIETMSAPAFRSIVADRLRTLERDVAEVRTRVNGLLFVVAGAVAAQVVLRLFG